MNRPDTVPANATWNPENNAWQLGEHNTEGKKTGLWQYWHVDEPKDVWMTEFVYHDPGIISTQRYFNKQLQPVCKTGMLLPARPASVPAQAHYIDNSGVSWWEIANIPDQTEDFTGEYLMWDLNGVLSIRRVYDPNTFEMAEGHQYQDGKLYSSRIIGEGTLESIHYYPDANPPVRKESTLYTNNEKDNTHTFYDQTGQPLFSVRHEKISKYHERRYYNGHLVYEGIRPDDPQQPPVGVNYYYPDGTVMIGYHSNGDGTGYWQLYEEDGSASTQLPISGQEHRQQYNDHITDEEYYNDYKQWNKFLPTISTYKPSTTQSEWEIVKAAFHAKYTKDMLGIQLAALPVPAYLQQALDVYDWEQISTAMGGGRALPLYIKGLLAESDELAKSCSGKIWMEIAHQGSVYEATYAVAGIVATCLPQLPAIQERLVEFLFSVLSLQQIGNNKQLNKSLATCKEIFETRAAHTDDVIALKALYLLSLTGEATVIKATWQDAAHSLFRRSYALFALGNLYVRSKQVPVLISEFSAALDSAQEKLIRLVLAIHLVAATKKEAQDTWLAELVRALTSPGDVKDDFNELYPFIGDYDVQEYVMMVLGFAHPDTLGQHIVPVIAMLPGADVLKQETLLYCILGVLFPKKAALKAMTPVRQQALLAAADVLEKGAAFVNMDQLFRKYGLPANAVKLRQLATK